jgi:DNA-binding MarR family transcriptional regulator
MGLQPSTWGISHYNGNIRHLVPTVVDPLLKRRTDPDLEPLMKVINLFRLQDEEVPAQLITVFLYIASHNPCHLQAIEEDTGLSPNSTSRNTDWLSTHHRLGKPGLGLIRKIVDPKNRRRRMAELTRKGEMLAATIKEELYG